MTSKEEYLEHIVCHEDEICENGMKEVNFGKQGDLKMLVVKQHNRIYALGSKCPHFGAPLCNGMLGEGRIRCPWHSAAFNIESGDIEDFPGLDSIHSFDVEIKMGLVKVRAKKSKVEKVARLKAMVYKSPYDFRIFVIVGGGPSGGVCAETLRQEGYAGRIILISNEKSFPYDRTRLSKAMHLSVTDIQYRDEEFYKKYDIEVYLDAVATELNTNTGVISCADGKWWQYDKLYIATGSRPFQPSIPGSDLSNIFMLRSCEDSSRIFESLKVDTELVCLGGSFISMESAAFCVQHVKSVCFVV